MAFSLHMTLCLVRVVRQGPLDPHPGAIGPVRPSLELVISRLGLPAVSAPQQGSSR